jgi:hypothetical protein
LCSSHSSSVRVFGESSLWQRKGNDIAHARHAAPRFDFDKNTQKS